MSVNFVFSSVTLMGVCVSVCPTSTVSVLLGHTFTIAINGSTTSPRPEIFLRRTFSMHNYPIHLDELLAIHMYILCIRVRLSGDMRCMDLTYVQRIRVRISCRAVVSRHETPKNDK